MNNSPKKALILDFGGVISRTMFETHDLTEKALGLPKGALKWLGPFDSENDKLWQEMQAREITEREYWLTRTKEVGKLVGQNWTSMEQFVKAARGVSPDEIIRKEFIEAFSKVKEAGIKCGILSNELDLFYGADFRKKLPFLKEFDVIIDATYTGVLKPDPRAYLSVCDVLNLDVSDCVFVDDQLKNCEGAISIGMTTVHFDVISPRKSYNEALRYFELEEL